MFEEIKVIFQSSKKNNNNDRIFFKHGTSFTGCRKTMVLNFSWEESPVFFEPKCWWKYDTYWLLKCSCFELFGDGKYDLFWGKKLMERWYLLVTEKSLFWAFPWWKMQSFLRQKFNGKMIFTDYWKVLVLGYRKILVLSFSVMWNTVSF